ncbi:Pre-rRNA-processing protein fhl1 [Cichlidogyrus casuarinus]|uniref:Pre-rRNA-processing protein fhl1 n=1 Tax=Cichlidogyrus casuarinus TaxID=1844966 RepID=A0ABD2PX01_9PLAT
MTRLSMAIAFLLVGTALAADATTTTTTTKTTTKTTTTDWDDDDYEDDDEDDDEDDNEDDDDDYDDDEDDGKNAEDASMFMPSGGEKDKYTEDSNTIIETRVKELIEELLKDNGKFVKETVKAINIDETQLTTQLNALERKFDELETKADGSSPVEDKKQATNDERRIIV